MVEVLVMLRKALEVTSGQADQSTSTFVADTLSKYAELLAAQGNLATAISYLGNSNEVSLDLLRAKCNVLGACCKNFIQSHLDFIMLHFH